VPLFMYKYRNNKKVSIYCRKVKRSDITFLNFKVEVFQSGVNGKNLLHTRGSIHISG